MKIAKRLLMSGTIAILALMVTIGGSFALFTAEAEIKGDFSAGTLKVDASRQDVPMTGPMFYTNDNLATGMMGTGYWAPGDTHTRAMFVKNTGSLDAKLQKLYAIPEGMNTEDALEFAKQSLITIAVMEAPKGTNIGAKALYELNRQQEELFKEKETLFWNKWKEKWFGIPIEEQKRLYFEFLADVREALQKQIFIVDGKTFEVKTVYSGTLDNLYNEGNGVPAKINLKLSRGQVAYMGYTVHFMNLNNDLNNRLQEKEVKFTFKSSYVQAKNNP